MMADIQRYSVQFIRSEHIQEDTTKNLRLLEKTLIDQQTAIEALQVAIKNTAQNKGA